MTWNWQRDDWPHFSWDRTGLVELEEQFLLEAGVLAGAVQHLPLEEREQLTIESMSAEALTTSAIEGELLERASVQSSIRRQLGLATDDRRAGPAEQGIAEMMVDLQRRFAEPLSDEVLCAWNAMILRGRSDLPDAGAYRTSAEPMQVVSGALHARKVHFEAPPSPAVPGEMARFIDWFNNTAPASTQPLSALTRAGTAHLYFVSIHPFEDGNGRLARAIAEKALAQGLRGRTPIALAPAILAHRKGYYQALEAADQSNEITAWLIWFGQTAIEAQRNTIAGIEFLIQKTRLLDRLRGQLNARQEKALLRMLREGPGGFQGGLSAGNYETITGASPATTTRDLGDLVAKGALVRRGERRHARYHLAIAPKPPAQP